MQDEELAAIVLATIGGGARGQGRADEPRLQRITEHLHHLTVTLQDGLQEQARSPSAKELEAQVERIDRLAGELSEALFSLPPPSLTLLNTTYHTQQGWDDAAHSFVDLGLGTAPAELAASAISEAARALLDGWRNGSSSGRVPPDKPGPQRALQRILGDPRLFLADQVARLVTQEQGIDAVTADVKGPVYEVVAMLWTYATGRPEERANLRLYVRRAARSARLRSHERDVRHQLEQLRRSFYADPAQYMDADRKQEFHRQVGLLENQAWELGMKAHACLWGYPPAPA